MASHLVTRKASSAARLGYNQDYRPDSLGKE